MCNTSDWIHCNKNPTLHRHPQNRNQSQGRPSKLAEKEPDLKFQLLLENKGKTHTHTNTHKSFFLLLAPSYGSPGLPSTYLKLGTRKQLLLPPQHTHTHKNGHPLLLLPRHFLPFPPSPIFFQAETFACRVGVRLPITAPSGEGGGGRKRASTKINEERTCCKEPQFPPRCRLGRTGRSLGHGAWRPAWGGGGEAPGDALATAKSSPISKPDEKSHGESRCVWLLCAERGPGGAWRPRRLRGSRRPSSSPRRRWAAPRSSSAARSRRTARPPRLCFWPTSP